MNAAEAVTVVRFGENLEWLVTNGIGGYASGSVLGGRRRVYHGVLVAADTPPVGRALRVPFTREIAHYRGNSYDLTTISWVDGTVAPDAGRSLVRFRLEEGLPVWEFRLADAVLLRRLWMPDRRNETRIRYEIVSATAPIQLEVTAFAADRDHHAINRGRPALASAVSDGVLHVERSSDGKLVLMVGWAKMAAKPTPVWNAVDEVYHGSHLAVERYRGLPDTEDLWVAGWSTIDLDAADATAELALAAFGEGAGTAVEVGDTLYSERSRRRALLDRFRSVVPRSTPITPSVEQLVLAADQFIVDRRLPDGEAGKTIIAGYPWFGDWGRDTMVSLPGLTITTGRYEEARWILRTFARYVDGGMLPNLFPDGQSEPEYNTVDATLWFFEAIRAYMEATDDTGFAREVLPVLRSIIDYHVSGTRYGIVMDESDGLLRAGEPGVQLTWMDARVEDWVVTPRTGKPVEINALWHHALVVAAALERRTGGSTERIAMYTAAADRAAASFGRFIGRTGLLDVIDGPDGDDATVRPNQIFAVSLAALRAGDPTVDDAPLVSPAVAANVLDTITRTLLTPQGLRSLEPGHPAYRGSYGGTPRERDSVYHQGAVWGWLVGPFVDAHLAVHRNPALITPLLDSTIEIVLGSGCLGTVAEIYDGDAPHVERGACAQAWSVAELLRAWRRVATS